MRGEIDPQASMFSYVDLESRIPKDHPIRKIRDIVDTALEEIEPWFDDMYCHRWTPLHSTRDAAPSFLVADSVYRTVRASIVREDRLRPDVPLVRGPGHG